MIDQVEAENNKYYQLGYRAVLADKCDNDFKRDKEQWIELYKDRTLMS